MPSSETVELRQRADDELQQELEDVHQSLFNLRFQTATRQLADVSQVRKAKRRIARIETLIRERDIVAGPESEAHRVMVGDTVDDRVPTVADGDSAEDEAAEVKAADVDEE